MKIVDVAEYYSDGGGGIRTYINAKMAAAAKHGHEVVVIAPGREDREEPRLGGKIIWVKGPAMPFDDRYGILWNMRAVHRAIDREQPDVLEGSSVWAGGQFAARWKGDALRALIFHQDPVAVIPHTYLDRFVARSTIDGMFYPIWSYLRGVSRRYDVTVVAGQWLGERLKGFKVHNPVAVPFGIDKDVFSPEKRCDKTRRDLLASCGQGPDATLFLIVSRFHPEKRLATLFEAFNAFQSQRPAALVVFGAGYLSKKVKRLAEDNPAIRLAGYTESREELARVYASADAMLHGSAAETFGLGVAEAICSGLPIVAPNVGGAADLVTEECGTLYDPGDVTGCAAAAQALVEQPRSHWASGLAARAERINTVEQHFEGLFRCYETLLAKRA